MVQSKRLPTQNVRRHNAKVANSETSAAAVYSKPRETDAAHKAKGELSIRTMAPCFSPSRRRAPVDVCEKKTTDREREKERKEETAETESRNSAS